MSGLESSPSLPASNPDDRPTAEDLETMHLEARVFLQIQALESSGVRFVSTGSILQTWVPQTIPDGPIRVFTAAYKGIILAHLRARDAAYCGDHGLTLERLYYARETVRRGVFSEGR